MPWPALLTSIARKSWLALLVASLFVSSAPGAPPAPRERGRSRDRDKVDFNFDIRPILSDRCFLCHGPDERSRKADMRLDTPEGAIASESIVPGHPEESELFRRIGPGIEDEERMPPRKSNLSLDPREVKLIERWIAEGAEYKPHWAFLPLPAQVDVPVPPPELKGKGPDWASGAVDRFVLDRLVEEGLEPSPAAARDEWLRRVTLDLTGLPPTPDEADAFLDDRSPLAESRVVDRLLASPRFGERMALEWLDVARYADSFGYQADGENHLWPYRDWVIRAFNQNLPYDQFVTWQIAGDLLDKPTRDQKLATAFCRLNRMTNEGGSIPEEFRNEYVSDRVHTFGTAFLALTLECSRCHDHKYDPITTKDYYGLGAFFNSIDEWGTYDHAQYRPTPTLALTTPAQEDRLATLKRAVNEAETRLAEAVSAPEREASLRRWLDQPEIKVEVPDLAGRFPLDRIESGNRLANDAAPDRSGTTNPANTLVPGKLGQALQLTGDDPAKFPGLPPDLDRWQPFTVAFWLRTPSVMTREVVFHRTAGTDTGFHGIELTFDQGRLVLSLIRFWPGNAIAVRTIDPIKTETWVQVAVSHDGSGRASGLRISLDGRAASVEIVRDHLTKNVGVKDTGGELTFGERFRSPGLKGAFIDDVQLSTGAPDSDRARAAS